MGFTDDENGSSPSTFGGICLGGDGGLLKTIISNHHWSYRVIHGRKRRGMLRRF